MDSLNHMTSDSAVETETGSDSYSCGRLRLNVSLSHLKGGKDNSFKNLLILKLLKQEIK